MSTTIPQGATEPIEALLLDGSLTPASGLVDVLVMVRRQSDGYTYDWDDSTFKTYASCTTPQQTMTEVNGANYPGAYATDWTAPSADAIYEVQVIQYPGTDAANVPQFGEIRVGGWIDDVPDILDDTDAIDTRLPSDPADESLQQASHSQTQTDIGNLNNLSSADVQAAMTSQGYTTVRAPYLDELAAANLPADIDTLVSRLTALRAGYLDELSAANIPADIDTLLSRLTAVRAVLLDNLVNLDAAISTVISAIGALNDISSADVQAAMTSQGYTTVRAALLDNLDGAISAVLTAIGLLNDLSQAQSQAACASALTAYDGPTKSELDTAETNIITQVNANETKIDAIQVLVNRLNQFSSGRWKINITTKQITYYDTGGTPLATFNLFDKNGNPAYVNITERVPV